MSRYDALFAALDAKNEGAFVPFVTLGDPNEEASYRIIKALIEGGADALELGVPFSDPVADGPTIQAAHIRAHASGIDVDAALRIVRRIRDEHADIPIGLLIYGNVAFARGTEQFYRDVAQAGADSVLLPDIPVREGESFAQAATAAGVDPIFIAPPHANPSTLEGVARLSRGYIYAVSRVGVTGLKRNPRPRAFPTLSPTSIALGERRRYSASAFPHPPMLRTPSPRVPPEPSPVPQLPRSSQNTASNKRTDTGLLKMTVRSTMISSLTFSR